MIQKAVITSDIVQSSSLSVEQRIPLLKHIEDTFITLNNQFSLVGEVYRGDSFQCLVHQSRHGLRVALLLKTRIKGWSPLEAKITKDLKNSTEEIKRSFDVRMSLAVGNVEMETNQVVTSDGEAFRLSGRRLDEMKKLKQHFSVISNDVYQKELSTESVLLDALLAKTTTLQCEVLYYKLLGQTEVAIADQLNIQQAAVNQRATSGSWHAIETALNRFEEIYG